MDQRIQKEVGMPLAWFDILVNLYIAPDRRLRMRDLAQTIVLTRSGITRLVDRIEEAGYVRREPSAEDRRGYYAVLTEKGVEVTERAQAIHGVDIDTHFMHFLNKNEDKALKKIMFRIWEENPIFTRENDLG
jgi:DNA-binding MarR family transcriptional regulator